MSALVGATANQEAYEEYLDAMGAAKAKDNVFGAICYCPITDLDLADMDKPELYAMYDSGFQDNIYRRGRLPL